MKEKHALLLGASGLIGSHILKQLFGHAEYTKITLLVRKKLALENPKLSQVVVDFNDPDSWASTFENVDVVYCAIGTTRSKTPDLTMYRKVDYDIPVNAIMNAEKNHVPQFMLVSSVGADEKSKNFYLKIKGDVEAELNKAQIDVRGVFQPSLLLGERKEKRFGEGIAKVIMPLLNFIVPMKYKAIHASDVAMAMIRASLNQGTGYKVYLYHDMVAQS